MNRPHRQVRTLAAEKGTSLSALIRDYLTSLSIEPLSDQETEGHSGSDTERRRRLKELFDDWGRPRHRLKDVGESA